MYEDYDVPFHKPILGFWKVSENSIKHHYDSEIKSVVYFGRFLSRNAGFPVYRLEWMVGGDMHPMVNFPVAWIKHMAANEELMNYLATDNFTVDEFCSWLFQHEYEDLSEKVASHAIAQIEIDRSVEKILSGL